MYRTCSAFTVTLSIAVVTGCDRAPRDTAVAVTSTPASAAAAKTLARPDAYRIGYDPSTRVLTLYDLADEQGHWMIAGPRNEKGVPVSNGHTFATDVDLDKVAVFYTTSHGQSSPRITLREVLTMQVVHHR